MNFFTFQVVWCLNTSKTSWVNDYIYTRFLCASSMLHKFKLILSSVFQLDSKKFPFFIVLLCALTCLSDSKCERSEHSISCTGENFTSAIDSINGSIRSLAFFKVLDFQTLDEASLKSLKYLVDDLDSLTISRSAIKVV